VKKRGMLLLWVLVLCCLVMTGCSGDSQGTAVQKSEGYQVLFSLNYEGAPDGETVEVAAESAAEPPENPQRSGYAFTGWYTDAETTAEADFEVAILENTTFYAGWKKTAATVTFDPNYEGAETATEEVEIGTAVSTPVSPVRDGYLFTAWYTDAELSAAYDFSSAVEDDLTLYAGWEQDSGNNFRVTFDWNTNDLGVYDTVTVKKLGFASAPALSLDGKYLEGWYRDAACTERFDFTTRIRENITLYANWLNIYTFEAEYTDLTGLEGMGYSGNASGTKMIEDGRDRGASNDAYVGWLYSEGLTLTFPVVSSAETSNIRLALSLSAEFYDITLTDTTFTVAVNGERVSYNPIVFEGVTKADLPFKTYVLEGSVTLNAGENIITVSVTNSEKKTGTIYATAPMIDALYVYADADVTWREGYPKTDNLK
jgi:uncharacterized repeat protein (TIGR02543 family)